MVHALRFLVLLYVVWLFALWTLQERMLFPGSVARRVPARDRCPPDAEVIVLTTEQNTRTEAWLLPAPSRTPRPAPLLVFLHGNAELIDDWPWRVRPWLDRGYHVLLPEYRGFGRSTGTPGQDAIVGDTLALMRQVRARPDVDPGRLVIHGRSIGGSIAALVAARQTPTAMILESAPADVTQLTGRYLAPAFLLRHPFRAAEALRGQPIPTLIMHGTRDLTVPFRQAELFDQALPDATLVPYDCRHNDLPPDYDHYWRQIDALLSRVPNLPAGP